MIINGLSKLTLLDFPGRVASTVFLAGCNLRCPFCHNTPLVLRADTAEQISLSELLSFLERRRGLIDGVCVTGGEPTLRSDLPELLGAIKALGFDVKLDTNGTNPGVLFSLIESGLIDYVAMDIKNTPEKYPMTVGVSDFDPAPIIESAAILLLGRVDYEFRTTVVEGYHQKEDFVKIGRWLSGARRYFLQNFKDSGDLIIPGTAGVSPELMEEFLRAVRQYIPSAELRGM